MTNLIDDYLTPGAVISSDLAEDIAVCANHLIQLREQAAHYDAMAATDKLTGLFNRRYAVRAFSKLSSVNHSPEHRRNEQRMFLGLLMFDADHFKRINDSCGHPAGDVVLQHIARIFQHTVRDNDIAFRWGGEEFGAILLPSKQANEASSVAQGAGLLAERVRVALETTPCSFVDKNGVAQTIVVTGSFGASAVEIGTSDSLSDALKYPDQYLYVAKKTGRNRVVTGDDQGNIISTLDQGFPVDLDLPTHEESEPLQAPQTKIASQDPEKAFCNLVYAVERTHVEMMRSRQLAIHDELTGVLNRHGLEIEFDRLSKNAARSGRQVTVVALDIDYFKRVNDTFGHDVGDLLLKHLVKVIETTTRKSDIVCRQGGEEFCVVFDTESSRRAVRLAQRLRRAIEKTPLVYDKEGQISTVPFTASIGVQTFKPGAKTLPDALEGADKLLYKAKEGGRNCVAYVRAHSNAVTLLRENAHRTIGHVFNYPKVARLEP